MKIGILSAHRSNERPAADNLRIGNEIEELGHDPVYVNYRRSLIGLTHATNGLYQYSRDGSKI